MPWNTGKASYVTREQYYYQNQEWVKLASVYRHLLILLLHFIVVYLGVFNFKVELSGGAHLVRASLKIGAV